MVYVKALLSQFAGAHHLAPGKVWDNIWAVPLANPASPNLFWCGCVEQKNQAARFRVNPQELQ